MLSLKYLQLPQYYIYHMYHIYVNSSEQLQICMLESNLNETTVVTF